MAEVVTRPDGRYLDGTVGGGGHLARMLDSLGAGARLLGLDRDPRAIEAARRRIGEDPRLVLKRAPFADLAKIAEQEGMVPLDGILLDLGVSSRQLDDPERGFTYREEAPLDMRMDPDLPATAADLLAEFPEAELAGLFRRYGEVSSPRKLAGLVARARAREPLRTSGELAELVGRTVAPAKRNAELSRVFQALRIAVNDELGQLEEALAAAVSVLAPGGRMAVIAYHSLEDRIVKHYFREQAGRSMPPRGLPEPPGAEEPNLVIVTPRPIRPEEAEIVANPRARSARLRVAERRGTQVSR